ncbi:MAG: 16S rRNA processing protein RimM [Burkholderiales bacterium]|nr:16S rRNA processing protein RimM [Burkholderiales bacterium]
MNGVPTQGECEQPQGRLVSMGRVQGAFGVQGWIRVEPFGETPAGLARFDTWWIGAQGSWRAVRVAQAQVQGRRLVAQLDGVSQRETATALRGAEVAVPRAALPEPGPGEYYQVDLVGMQVVNRAGERLGRIERVFDTGAHPVLELRAGVESDGDANDGDANDGEANDGEAIDGEAAGALRLIPFVAAFVDGVDLEARQVRVDWGADW